LQINHEEAQAVVQSLTAFPVCTITSDLVLAAIELRQRYNVSYWDAAILTAARIMGCEVVYSEDLNAGQDYGGVRVENPFASTGI
jgi:predicted nucleic acid-binding protein